MSDVTDGFPRRPSCSLRADEKLYELVTDVIDVVADLPAARATVWDLLLDPQTYPRVFTGIGACSRLDLPPAVRARYDTSSLRQVISCGAPLAGATVLRFMDVYGDILYNVYGSTEVSWATIATPADLRFAPTTAGRPPLGTRVAVLGPDHKPVPLGATGHIFVGNHMLFDGYVDAAPPDEAHGMLDTGDIGYFDINRRLFIAGRDDEMIISGGENVFPRPVEEALAHLPQVSEVAVVGVPDPEFGQRLAAFVIWCAPISAIASAGSRCPGTSPSSRPCRAGKPGKY